MAVRFLRTTHRNGTYRADLPLHSEVWDKHGFTGHMLSPDEPMTIDQVHGEIVSYCAQEHEPPMPVTEILEDLAALARADMVKIIVD